MDNDFYLSKSLINNDMIFDKIARLIVPCIKQLDFVKFVTSDPMIIIGPVADINQYLAAPIINKINISDKSFIHSIIYNKEIRLQKLIARIDIDFSNSWLPKLSFITIEIFKNGKYSETVVINKLKKIMTIPVHVLNEFIGGEYKINFWRYTKTMNQNTKNDDYTAYKFYTHRATIQYPFVYGDNDYCPICMGQTTFYDSNFWITPCLHMFHFECVQEYIRHKNYEVLCPICKTVIPNYQYNNSVIRIKTMFD
jgi:hypothetical protein